MKCLDSAKLFRVQNAEGQGKFALHAFLLSFHLRNYRETKLFEDYTLAVLNERDCLLSDFRTRPAVPCSIKRGNML